MAFVLDLDLQAVQYDVHTKGERSLVVIPVGYDDYDDWSYSLFVSLEPQAGGEIELSFCLVQYDGETDSEHPYWDAADVRRFINSHDRRIILACLLRAVHFLLESLKPQKVFVATIGSVENGAERKYVAIARVFELCGYAVHCADSYHGQRAWWMERK